MLTWHDAPRVARVIFEAPPLLQAQLYFRRLLLAPVGAPVLSFHRAPAEHLAMLTWHDAPHVARVIFGAPPPLQAR